MRKQFDFYGYNSPTDGFYEIDGTKYYAGEDFRSVKRYKEYKDVGFNILLLQHVNSYSGEPFEGSACHKCMTEAVKAGIDKIIVSDTRLKEITEEKILVGENGRFKTEKEFYEYLDYCTKPYRNQEGFFGVQLYDEPHGRYLENYGTIIKAMKKLFPDMYLQCNLLPLAGKEWLADECNDNFEAYEKYLNKYLDCSENDNVMFDEYPFRRKYLIGGYTLRTYQSVAKICRDRKKEMRAVLQSFSFVANNNLIHRPILEADMYWQTNMAMGFGVREFSFFTYMPKPKFSLKDENGKYISESFDCATFLSRDGSKTKLYNYTKRIIKEMKDFAPIALKYSFEDCYFALEAGKGYSDFTQTEFAEVTPESPLKTKISYGVGLVTKSQNGNSTLYMVENLGNVKDEVIDGKKPARFTIDLNSVESAKEIKFYYRGKEKKITAKDGKLKIAIKCGDALFIEYIR